ncbi:hypothetical protein OPQ81_000685 [Rhizoctonia solani]|nr:hypothetical protein OPQ81_000685 [Rhizoctonia solani]
MAQAYHAPPKLPSKPALPDCGGSYSQVLRPKAQPKPNSQSPGQHSPNHTNSQLCPQIRLFAHVTNKDRSYSTQKLGWRAFPIKASGISPNDSNIMPPDVSHWVSDLSKKIDHVIDMTFDVPRPMTHLDHHPACME